MAVKRILIIMQIPNVLVLNLPIDYIYQQCTASPFLEEYPEQINTPICSAGTAYTLGIIKMVISVFGRGLWFENGMER